MNARHCIVIVPNRSSSVDKIIRCLMKKNENIKEYSRLSSPNPTKVATTNIPVPGMNERNGSVIKKAGVIKSVERGFIKGEI